MGEITTTVSFEPTPMQLAIAFWAMDSDKAAAMWVELTANTQVQP